MNADFATARTRDARRLRLPAFSAQGRWLVAARRDHAFFSINQAPFHNLSLCEWLSIGAATVVDKRRQQSRRAELQLCLRRQEGRSNGCDASRLSQTQARSRHGPLLGNGAL